MSGARRAGDGVRDQGLPDPGGSAALHRSGPLGQVCPVTGNSQIAVHAKQIGPPPACPRLAKRTAGGWPPRSAPVDGDGEAEPGQGAGASGIVRKECAMLRIYKNLGFRLHHLLFKLLILFSHRDEYDDGEEDFTRV